MDWATFCPQQQRAPDMPPSEQIEEALKLPPRRPNTNCLDFVFFGCPTTNYTVAYETRANREEACSMCNESKAK